MTRLPLLTNEQVGSTDLVASIRKRRGGELTDLDRLLLHSPAFATGWGELMGRVRGALDLSPLLRELAMCGVAVLNGAEYEFFHHAPPFKTAGGTEEQVQAIRLIGEANFPKHLFNQVENDTLDLTYQMTRNIKVDGELMKRLHQDLESTKTVELVTVVAAYNMVSRFLIALDVNPEDHPPA